MPAAKPATPVFRDAAHRRAAMRALVWRIPLGTVSFAVLGPLAGMILFFVIGWTWSLVTNPAGAFTGLAAILVAIPVMMPFSVPVAYMIGGMPAAITGFWVALLATFERSKPRLYAGSAAIGAAATWLYGAAMAMKAGARGAPDPGSILSAAIGAASALVCTYLFRGLFDAGRSGGPRQTRRPFESRDHRRDRFTKARAARLAKERAKA